MFLSFLSLLASLLPIPGIAEITEETTNCDSCNCWSVKYGLLEDCPYGSWIGAGCASSQDNTPGNLVEPWDYSGKNVLDLKAQQE